jgi:hypothetical protein
VVDRQAQAQLRHPRHEQLLPAHGLGRFDLPARKGYTYPGADELPWIRSGAFGLDSGVIMATTKQLIVDTDADLDAVSYEIIATRGRFKDAREYSKGPKPRSARNTS